jgi:hypothetical protein
MPTRGFTDPDRLLAVVKEIMSEDHRTPAEPPASHDYEACVAGWREPNSRAVNDGLGESGHGPAVCRRGGAGSRGGGGAGRVCADLTTEVPWFTKSTALVRENPLRSGSLQGSVEAVDLTGGEFHRGSGVRHTRVVDGGERLKVHCSTIELGGQAIPLLLGTHLLQVPLLWPRTIGIF